MPFKANRERRHRIPRQQYRVTNWPAYDAALQARGSLMVWFTAEAIAAWRADKGHDLRLIQDYLGHRDPRHTVHYTRTTGCRFEGLWR